MKEAFVLIVMIWGAFGLMGLVHNCSYNRHTNWFMILFFITMPLLPFFAKICSLI